MRSGTSALASAALLIALPFPIAAATCPTNTMSAPGISQVSADHSGSLSGSQTCVEGGNIHGFASGRCSYDLTQGTIAASGSGDIICTGSAQVLTHDVFTLTGPASASPISFSAVIHVDTYVFGFGSGGATIREGASNTSPNGSVIGGGSITVGITVTVLSGSSFDLYLEGGAGGAGGGASMGALLEFPDLPPGYVLQSCQGFSTIGAVPARPLTWGHLKTLYR